MRVPGNAGRVKVKNPPLLFWVIERIKITVHTVLAANPLLSGHPQDLHQSLGELEKAVGKRAVAFPVLPNFHSCFYNLIETKCIS